MQKILNILVASDHKSFRESLTRTLNSEPFFHVAAVCADSFAAVTMTDNAAPDIVIIDGSTDPLSTIEAIKKITACSGASVIGISKLPDTDFEKHLLTAGALGYLTHYSSAAQLICAVEEVAKDNRYSCSDANDEPIATAARISSVDQFIKKSIAGITRNRHTDNIRANHTHWHSILQFVN